MKCPKCDVPLAQVYLREVPIEQCEQCEGFWLDSGEFELIAERERTEEGWISKVFKGVFESLKKKSNAASATAMAPPTPTHGA
ncbi:MAG: zf-TFIIB domain-containing protein [Candidatus Obscuribacterales bacterium]|nr:zf-TFIIB domain-containing protein [Candidatus Obscuribacterales bacterium]